MYRTISLVFLTLIAALALFLTPAFAAKSFPETGFSITSDKVQDYFDHRGGIRVFGYPISREFDFLGTRVQFFQRAVLQLQSNGGVALLNILDEGLLPYTRINGSAFPAPDPSVIQASPSPSDPNYASKALDFIRNYAPDSWQGMPTNFYATFMNTVAYNDAFPDGGIDQSIMPLINLEIWGLPTSKPTLDPNNNNFVYLRFQRGIMHFDKTSGLTQGILIGDYLKSVITGQNLPADLEQQANSSRLYRQYTNSTVSGLNRPNDLPATTIFASFEKDGVNLTPPAAAPATTTPVPAARPALPPRPDRVEIIGNPWFADQTMDALKLLPASVRDHVQRIEITFNASYIDPTKCTLYVVEADAFAYDWKSDRDIQLEWYASLIMHNSVHIEQYYAGRPYEGPEAEREAQLRQKSILIGIDKSPDKRLTEGLTNAINKGDGSVGHWPVMLPR